MRHFDISEFACPCGCGGAGMDAGFLARLDRAREAAGVPFAVNSGYRCPAHNRAVGGSPNSSHLRGLAADVAAVDSRARARVLAGLHAAGFTRIGIARSFIHVDADRGKDQDVVWLYA